MSHRKRSSDLVFVLLVVVSCCGEMGLFLYVDLICCVLFPFGLVPLGVFVCVALPSFIFLFFFLYGGLFVGCLLA